MAQYNTRKSGAAAKAETLQRRQIRAAKARTLTTKGGRTVVRADRAR